jgi:phosphoribosylanthranilate isomerase
MSNGVRVKICGVRTLGDAAFAIEAGADLVGINLVPSSVRYLDPPAAAALVALVRARFSRQQVELVAVVADQEPEPLRALLAHTPFDSLQLHGSESAQTVSLLAPIAYKAVRIREAVDVESARSFPGRRLLVDAKVDGQLGGTGERFDWELLGALPRERDLFLAGGLDAENVARAVECVRPFAVDVSSGVESAPGQKDRTLVARFIERAKGA